MNPMLYRFFSHNGVLISLISANALLIFVQGFFQATDPISPYLEFLDHMLTLFFALEAGVKMLHLGWKGYVKDGWNVFDFILVLVALPSLVVWATGLDVVRLEFLLIFRILRVFKFFRVLKFVPNVENLIMGIFRAVRSSILVVFAFFIFNFIFAILSYSLFAEVAPEHFANPLLSFYTTFKIFTIEGWYEIPDLIAERADHTFLAIFARIYFVLLLFGGGIFGLSLINSIFVDSMMSDNNDAMEKKLGELEAKIDRLLENKEEK
jgi:voltage-gated sodium channel